MWEATVGERVLNFHLAGINNQNFIMRDEETGSWWQQISGEAIQGPMKGQKLKLVSHDELAFGIWKGENPEGRVLRPDQDLLAAGKYAPPDWEDRMSRVPVVTQAVDDRLEPRSLIAGVNINGASKAYPFDKLEKQSAVIDKVGGVAILIFLADDKKSLRAFERSVDGRELEFFVKPGAAPARLVDAETGSEWDFAGAAVAGPLAGRQLKKVYVLKDYWFDWRAYHPDTEVY